MKPERIPRTVTLIGTVYRVVVSPCPLLYVRDGDTGRAERVRNFLDPVGRVVLLPAGTDPADWPAIVSDLEESAAADALDDCGGAGRAQVVPVFHAEYTILECPHPIVHDGEECQYQLDHRECVIWIARGMSARDRERVVALAVAACWREWVEHGYGAA